MFTTNNNLYNFVQESPRSHFMPRALNSYYCKSKTFPKFFLNDFKTLSLKKKKIFGFQYIKIYKKCKIWKVTKSKKIKICQIV